AASSFTFRCTGSERINRFRPDNFSFTRTSLAMISSQHLSGFFHRKRLAPEVATKVTQLQVTQIIRATQRTRDNVIDALGERGRPLCSEINFSATKVTA